jgi:hypothetical protein
MKKNLLTLIMVAVASISMAQTAPDFTANDCNGNSHNLYTELAQGKVIVLNWVMPCGACVGPSLTAYNVSQSFANPNVLYYLIDDAGNTVCTAVNSWATSSGIGANRTTFSTSSITESNYGGVGMPHVTVVGPNGHIYFTGLNAAAGNSTAIQNAISSAITATGIAQNNSSASPFSVTPSLSTPSVKVTYSLIESANVVLEMLNESGQSVSTKSIGKQAIGNYTYDYDVNKSAAGIYFMRFTAGNNSQIVKFTVTK